MTNPPKLQIEQTLTQRIQTLYQDRLGKRLGKVTCRLFDEKIAIVLEESITQPERLLLKTEDRKFVESLRCELDSLMTAQLKAVIEEVVGTPVIALLNNSDLEADLSGIIVLLATKPIA
jgi:uncharacterized protein YbcI